MSRIAFVVAFLWVVACTTDDPTVTDPEQPAVSPDNAASDLEVDFTRGKFNSAHTAYSGGATTVFDESAEAFGQAAPNLSGETAEQHEEGDEAFEQPFVSTPGLSNSGLGPVFDNVSCEMCHVGDGRGRPPLPLGSAFSLALPFNTLLFRASIAGFGPHGGPKPVPSFGGQLQLQAVQNYSAEITAAVQYVSTLGTFSDGSQFELMKPQYQLNGSYAPLPPGLLFSPRVAPVVFGLGLLEAVPAQSIFAAADPRDRNHDGISGRVNTVWDEVRQRYAVGRFGWKANVSNLVQQTAGAYNGDMGITSSLFPKESCDGRPGCDSNHPAEVDDETVENVALYARTLGVPARRNLDDPKATKGEQLFFAAGCASCHTPTLRTGKFPGLPEISHQVIHPYTDLLVHDMGPDLADGRPDFQASGSEWRTPPLWGIGLVQTVNQHSNFLHDGRARSLLEAVLWHGGEAKSAQSRVLKMSAEERDALVAFLQSL
jgi:CxxC motif-containing protein (DUF1111 family)